MSEPATLDTALRNFPLPKSPEHLPHVDTWERLIRLRQYKEAREYAEAAAEVYRQWHEAWVEAEGFSAFQQALYRATHDVEA